VHESTFELVPHPADRSNKNMKLKAVTDFTPLLQKDTVDDNLDSEHPGSY
jgi:hypothetical protein